MSASRNVMTGKTLAPARISILVRRFVLAMLLAGPLAAAPEFSYGPLPEQRYDLYGRGPVVLWIHGGGWHSGDKRDVSRALIREMSLRGLAVAAVNFRQAPQVHVAESLADLQQAVSATHAVAVMGGSSGGHLACMLALRNRQVRAAVLKCPPTDLTRSGMNPVQAWTIERAFGRLPGPALRDWSPVQVAHAQAPPFLIFHGEQDDLVPISQSRALAARLRELHVPVQLVSVAHAGHEFQPVGGRPSLTDGQICRQVATFLWVSLRLPSQPKRSARPGRPGFWAHHNRGRDADRNCLLDAGAFVGRHHHRRPDPPAGADRESGQQLTDFFGQRSGGGGTGRLSVRGPAVEGR